MVLVKHLFRAFALLYLSASATSAGAHAAGWKSQMAVALTARGDADSLATAAALDFKPGSTNGALELAAHAAELAPQSAPIGWVHLQLCVEAPMCDFRDVATVLRWVDADNGASWLPVLAAAQKDKDGTEVDRVIADMAQAARFDLYRNRLVVLMTDAMRRARKDLPRGAAGSDAERFAAARRLADTDLLPSFAPLSDVCRSTAGGDRRTDCLKLSKIMQHADTIAAQVAGFAMERRLLPSDGKEAHEVLERRHVLEYRAGAAAQLDAPPLPWMKNAEARARLKQMRSMPREEDVCIAVLRAHKLPLEPMQNERGVKNRGP